MKFTGSIQKRLTAIILFVAFLTSLVGYGSFIYWYMEDQHKRSIDLSNTVATVLSQDIAKLLLLNDVSAAADLSSNLESFKTLNKMVLYKKDGIPAFQYSNNNKSFKVKPLIKKRNNFRKIKSDTIQIYINANYKDTHLGYVKMNLKIETIEEVILKNIQILLVILFFMFILSFILSNYFAKKFNKPVLDLVDFLEQIEKIESFDKEINITEDNEYGKLFYEVNTMLKRIKSSQEALKIAAVAFETPTGMTITDANQKIVQINTAFSEITGYTPAEVIGEHTAILKSGLHDKSFYDSMYNSLRKRNYWSGEIKNKRKDGTIYSEYLTIQSVKDSNNKIIYYVASFVDITLYEETKKKLEEKEMMLVQQSKMAAMGEMLENIAHQWRQPLSLISTIATSMVLTKEMGINSTLEEDIEKLNKINSSSQYLSHTIDDFRNFFKSNNPKDVFNIEDTYFTTLKLVNSKFDSLKIELIENIQNIEVLGLQNELKQVIMNILNNARDILEEKEQTRLIFVDIYKVENNALIKIKDNAGGIPEDIIERIFEPYFTTKHKKQGTGIGLYMAQEMIIKHMNGNLSVSNEMFTYKDIDYKGACFTITVPLS